MILGYPFDDVVSDPHNIKTLVVKSHVYCDKLTLRYDSNVKAVQPLPDDLPYDHYFSINNDYLEIFRKNVEYYYNVLDNVYVYIYIYIYIYM